MFVVTLAVGAVTVAAISLSPLYARRVRLVRSARLGTALVAGSIALGASSVATSGWPLLPRDELFLCLFAALLLGTLLILGDDAEEGPDDPNGWLDDSGGDPPWWPEFEAGFSRHVGRRRYPAASR